MKQLSILISLLIQTTLVFGQIANDDQSFFNYTYDRSTIARNRVRTVTIEMSFSEGKGSSKSIYHFDKDGLLTKQSVVDEDGKLKREFFFLTNSYNHLTFRIQRDIENKIVDTVKYFRSYSENKLIKDSSNDLPISRSYVYGLNGDPFKTVIILNFGFENYRKQEITNKFDTLNRISNSVEIVFQNKTDTTGVIFSDRDYFYYKNGKIENEVEKVNSSYSWMTNKGSINYVYDSTGNLTAVLRKNATSYYYTYNSNGLIIEKRTYIQLDSDDFIDAKTKVETFDKYSYTFR